MRLWPRGRTQVLTALGVLAGILGARVGLAQVVELQGTGSSIDHGYGLVANIWGDSYDGWVGVGFERGVHYGAQLRLHLGRDTLRLGDDALSLGYPTDVFGATYILLAEGATFAGTLPLRTHLQAFVGASATATDSGAVPSLSPQHPMGVLLLSTRITPWLMGFTSAVFAERQTFLEGLRWTASSSTAAIVAGVGANRPYDAVSATFDQAWMETRVSYTFVGSGFERADVPVVSPQPELDRENIVTTVRPAEWLALTGSWQNFVLDSADSQTRAQATSLVAHATLLNTQFSVGGYDSWTSDGGNVSGYLAVGRTFADVFGADVYLLHSVSSTGVTSTNPVVMLNEKANQKFSLNQMITLSGRQGTVSFGGSYLGSFGDVDAEYQILHTPFDIDHPFQRALALTVRLQMLGYTAGLNTAVGTTGAVSYTASGSTFLYMGASNGGAQQPVSLRMPRFIVRGDVRDEQGQPISGAAVLIAKDLVFTNSEGEFFQREGTERPLAVSVALDQFLIAGVFTVVAAPTTVTPVPDGTSAPIHIVVRRQ